MKSNSVYQFAFRRLVPRLVLPGCLFVCSLPAGLLAQTVVFTGARTLSSGFSGPVGVAVDGSGNVYVADVDKPAVYEMLAVGGSIPASPTIETLDSGLGAPEGVSVDGSGNVYVADERNNAVYEMLAVGGGIPASPTIRTLGSGFSVPTGVAVDGSGNVYVADFVNSAAAVYEMLAVGGSIPASPTIRTLGSGFKFPSGVAVDGSGNVYVADFGNNAVKEMLAVGGSIPASPTIRTLGSGFSCPQGVAVDGKGNVYVADTGNNAVKEMLAVGGSIPASPAIETLGNGFDDPAGVALDGSGNVFVGDYGSHAVKEILAAGTNLGKVNLGSTSVFLPLQFAFATGGTGVSSAVLTQGATGLDFADAGTGSCTTNGTSHTYSAGDTCTVNVTFTPRYAGLRRGAVRVLNAENGDVLATAPIYGVGVGSQIGFASGAQTVLGSGLGQTIGVAVDGAGDLFIGDATNGRVVEAPADGGPETTVVSSVDNPGEIAVDGAGDIFIADTNNARVLELPAGDGPPATVGSGLAAPAGVAVDGAGNVFISDFDNNNVVEVLANGSAQITVVTGLSLPKGIALDGAGDIFIANDGGGNVLEAPAGGGSLKAVGSGFSEPQAVAVDAAGDVFVADEGNSSLVEVPAGSGAQILLGNNAFNGPKGVAVDSAGDLFVADTFNERVVELPFSQPPPLTFSSGGGTQTVTVESIGNLPLALPGVEQGTNPAISDSSFVLNDTGNTACAVVTASASTPGTLTPGDTCALPITFSPTNGGTQSGTLVLTDNSLNASPTVFTSQTIPLSGTANANLPEITWSQPGPIQYGTALSATQLNATANVAGSFSYNPAAGTELGAGTHTLSVTFTPTNTTSYTTATTTVMLTVNQAVPAIAWATPAAINYGTALSGTQLDATSPVAGRFVYDPPAGTELPGGSQTLSVTFTPTDTSDYTIATATVQLTVNPTTPTPAALITPLPGSTFVGPSVTFTWTPGSGVTEYQLQLGTTPVNPTTLYDSGSTTATTVTVSGLPTAGVTVWVRLYSEIAGAWNVAYYTYTESGTPASPALTSPAPGSVLAGSSAAFTWTAGAGPAFYQLWLGTTGVGSNNLYDSGSTTAATETVSGLPTYGVTVFARLWWEIDAIWHSADYTYTEAGTPVLPVLTTPAPGSVLSGSSVAFTWAAGGGPAEYQLWLGTSGVGSSNLYDSGSTTVTTKTVSNLPTDGVTLYARLYWEIDGAWKFADYTYTEAGTLVPAALTSPTPGTVLSGSSVAFTWTAGVGPTAYQLSLGTTGAGSSNLYNSGSTTATTETASDLPTNGVKVYARLYQLIDGKWQSTDYTYTAQ